VKAVRQVCETNVPTLIQGADSLHQVSSGCVATVLLGLQVVHISSV
jgi:hypothetical protein